MGNAAMTEQYDLFSNKLIIDQYLNKEEADMPNIPGDATGEDIDQLIKKSLSEGIASSSETNPVRLTTAEATRVLELLGGYDPEDDPEPAPAVAPQQAAAAAEPAKKTRAQLNEMTKEELVDYADDHDIEVTASWSKADIVDAIAKGQK
jgi:hypothetical protein